MLAWLNSDVDSARGYVDHLFSSGAEIVERMQFISRSEVRISARLVPKAISPAMFDSGHRHELHLFLKHHFQQLTDNAKAGILDIIRGLPLPDRGAESERILLGIQKNWLTPIAGQGYAPVDEWLAELNDGATDASIFVPPEFNSYHEMHLGFGPTPHEAQEIVAFAENGTIIDRLNAFTPSNTWNGPSKRSLSDAVVEAVGAAPDTFIKILPRFTGAKPEYQYAVIAGFKKLWDAWDGKQAELAWDVIWTKLIDFFEALLNNEEFWKEEPVADEPVLSPTRDWIPPVIADFIKAGTRSDDKAYAPDLLPRTQSIVLVILSKSKPQPDPREGDALNGAINTSKGKAIEALFEHTLRRCRLSDKVKKSHVDVWTTVQPLFDAELAQCRGGNFEFSALAGAYIGNLHYMSGEWVHANFKALFPIDVPANCLAALDGFGFAPSSKPIFDLLIAAGVVDWALRQDMKGEHPRQRLLQRLGLSYLWGDQQLDGPRFKYFFEFQRKKELRELARYFWMARGEPLTDEQRERILLFWDRCVSWGGTIDSPPESLLSQLSLLSCYLTAVDERALKWLLAVVPYSPVNYHAHWVIEQLGRLADASPIEVSEVLRALLNTYQPDFDFENRISKLLVQRLHIPSLGVMHLSALSACGAFRGWRNYTLS